MNPHRSAHPVHSGAATCGASSRSDGRKRTSQRCRLQAGQALAEGMVGMALLAIVLSAVGLIGRYQDLALQAAHASRYAAFLQAAHRFQEDDLAELVLRHFFTDAGKRWRTDAGSALLVGTPSLKAQRHPDAASVSLSAVVPPSAVPLFREWGVGDEGILLTTVTASAKRTAPGSAAGHDIDTLAFGRSTAMLTGAGHAASDADVRLRLADGDTAWRRAARQSEVAGRAVASRMLPLDRAWGRAAPSFDWLSAWQGLVPSDRLGARP